MKFRTIATLSGAALALAACGGGEEAAPAPDANVTEIVVPETPAVVNVSTEEPAAAPVANTVEPPLPTATPTPFSDEEQTQADAAATGMTSRVDRNAPDEAGEQR
ncbi:hypothetical protein ACX40Y_12780 [Sphingomonas sp. RS6]